MKTTFRILVTGWILGYLLALSGRGTEIVTGLSLALGSVCFGLAFITKLITNAEAEETTKRAPAENRSNDTRLHGQRVLA